MKRMLASFVICMGIMYGWMYFTGKFEPKPKPTDAPPTTSQPVDAPAFTTTTPVTNAPSTLAPPQMQPNSTQWIVRQVDPETAPLILGNREAEQPYKAEITFDAASAAIQTVFLSEFKLNIKDEKTGYPLLLPALTSDHQTLRSFMLGKLKLKGRGETFDLSGNCWQADSVINSGEQQSVTFRATIVDAKNRPMLEVVKSYTYYANNYELDFDLKFNNLSYDDLQIESLEMVGPSGTIREERRYDRRNVLAAYQQDDGQVNIEQFSFREKDNNRGSVNKPSQTDALLWFGTNSRFFAAVARPLPTAGSSRVDYISQGKIEAQRVLIEPDYRQYQGVMKTGDTVLSRVTIVPRNALVSGREMVLNFKVYLGSIDTDLFNTSAFAGLHYDQLLNTYACAFCAFDWLMDLVLKLLKLVYNLTGNYGIAIILLVLLVRLALHPITKKGQVNMMGMSKMAPRMEELKKKYGDNKAELQKHTMAMYKEQGFNPVLGCLPMLLQMPIWIAIYTAVDANVALRHEGLLPAAWHWINDLSAPDGLIPFSVLGLKSFNLPMMIGYVDAINLLPFLLAIAMYLQTKYTAQPAAVSNPQMAQQQKMMKILMPIMMFVFLYGAPSGLNLYIMASTFGGVYEQYIIRKHIREQDEKEASTTTTTKTTINISKRLGKSKPKKPKRP